MNDCIFDTKEKSLHKTVMPQNASGRSSDHWKIARILGKITSGFPAVCFGPMHYRSLGRLGQDKFLALKFVEGSFEKEMEISQAWKMDILLDASKSGWGVFFDKKPLVDTFH